MGQPVTHFEVHGKDAAALNTFYGELFGWHVDSNNPMNYGMVDTHTNGKGIGGGITANPMQQSMVTVYVEVDDLQATLDKAEKLGGKTIMPSTEIPDMVTFALFSDPAGSVECDESLGSKPVGPQRWRSTGWPSMPVIEPTSTSVWSVCSHVDGTSTL